MRVHLHKNVKGKVFKSGLIKGVISHLSSLSPGVPLYVNIIVFKPHQ